MTFYTKPGARSRITDKTHRKAGCNDYRPDRCAGNACHRISKRHHNTAMEHLSVVSVFHRIRQQAYRHFPAADIINIDMKIIGHKTVRYVYFPYPCDNFLRFCKLLPRCQSYPPLLHKGEDGTTSPL